MTDKERIAALELSNQRMRQALEYIREEYLFTAHGFHVASKALSSSKPSKVVEVLRQCEEALRKQVVHEYCECGCESCEGCAADCSLRLEVSCALDALREIIG